MKKVLQSLILIAGLFLTTNSQAQRIFIKAVGSAGNVFDGGSTVQGHRDEIQAFAYSDGLVGCTTNSSSGGGSACKVTKSPFAFSMGVCFAVISFKKELITGKLLQSVDMVISHPSEGDEFIDYRVRMENVRVSSVSEGGDGSPTFNIELLPEKIAWQVIKQGNDGQAGATLSYGWDFRLNTVFNYVFP